MINNDLWADLTRHQLVTGVNRNTHFDKLITKQWGLISVNILEYKNTCIHIKT